MTEDTIFDMASLSKCLATATAIMQLYEAGKLQFDDPVAKYLPDFAANGKEGVTIRDLLTHYSGLPEDLSLKDPWGLAGPDKDEAVKRAMNATIYAPHGTHFKYSDINFITLGLIVEKLSGQSLDVYAQDHIFTPLDMTDTRYLEFDKVCGLGRDIPLPARSDFLNQMAKRDAGVAIDCGRHSWSASDLLPRIAPTAHDNEGTAETNPDFDRLLRGVVRAGRQARHAGRGVAGHAGVFSTAADVATFLEALLDKLLRNTGTFPLKQSTLQLMTKPEQPATAVTGATTFTADGKATTGVAARGFGWDINSAFSRPRSEVALAILGSFSATPASPEPRCGWIRAATPSL